MEQDSEFDIILWGATGAAGRRVAHHLASRCAREGDVRWAIAGRNLAKLESVRSALDPAARDIPIITGDSHDVASLDAFPWANFSSPVCSCWFSYGSWPRFWKRGIGWIKKSLRQVPAAPSEQS